MLLKHAAIDSPALSINADPLFTLEDVISILGEVAKYLYSDLKLLVNYKSRAAELKHEVNLHF